MESHIKALGMLFILFGVFGLLAAVTVFVVGAGAVATILAEESGPDARVGAAWAGGCLSIVAAVVAVISIPNLIAGWGLLSRKSWSRVLTLILAVLHLPGFPFGTALGVYALVVMLNDETPGLLTG